MRKVAPSTGYETLVYDCILARIDVLFSTKATTSAQPAVAWRAPICLAAILPTRQTFKYVVKYRKNRVGDNAMEVLLALAIYFAIWVLVIWGAGYFNKHVV